MCVWLHLILCNRWESTLTLTLTSFCVIGGSPPCGFQSVIESPDYQQVDVRRRHMCEKPYARAYVLVFNKPFPVLGSGVRVRVLRFLFASFLVVCVTEVSVRPHINRPTDTQTHRHTDTQTHRYTDTHTHMHAHTTHTHTRNHTHTHMHTHTHPYAHTQTHAPAHAGKQTKYRQILKNTRAQAYTDRQTHARTPW